MNSLTVAQRIRQARERAGLTQVQLAERLGVHGNTISGWERGTQEPRGHLLLKLSAQLRVTPFWLQGGKEEPIEPTNRDLLLAIVDEVDRYLEKEKIELPGRKKYSICFLIHDELLKSGTTEISQNKIIDLVKIAI